MTTVISLKRRIQFQEQDIAHIDLHSTDNGRCFANIFLKPRTITVSGKTALAIAKAFPQKTNPI
jgi:hypothetical protein